MLHFPEKCVPEWNALCALGARHCSSAFSRHLASTQHDLEWVLCTYLQRRELRLSEPSQMFPSYAVGEISYLGLVTPVPFFSSTTAHCLPRSLLEIEPEKSLTHNPLVTKPSQKSLAWKRLSSGQQVRQLPSLRLEFPSWHLPNQLTLKHVPSHR